MAKNGREIFDKYMVVFNIIQKAINVLPFKFRKKRFEMLRNKKGKIGILLRYLYLKSLAKKCGSNVSVHPDVYILNPEKLIVGDNVSIHPMCYIECAGNVEIGNDVAIAHNVSILSTTHTYDSLDEKIKYQNMECKKTFIGSDVWIGAKSTILAGKTIGNGCVIGANSVVTHDVFDFEVHAGIPARKIKTRIGK